MKASTRASTRTGPHRGAGLAGELGHGLVEHLDVELEAERRDVAGLLGAEQVAGAADLEVAHRDLEAGAELRVVGERRQPRARLRRQLARIGVEEVGVRRDVRAADAPADLVELAQAEGVGALDDERVRLRDVDPRFDDRRRDEHVGVAREERVHPLLEIALAHLAVRDEEAEAGAELAQLLAHLLDRLDAVVEVERLAAARVLALERDLDQLLVVLAHGRPDRPAPLGRRLDDRDVAQTRERHVERARDRRRGEREHVDLEPQRAEQLLLGDAEALLLVEDDEAELLRDHVAGEDAVRPDEDVDLAGGEVGEHLLRLGRLAEARDHLDVEREVAEALAEGVPVLLGEDRRRAEHEHLPAVDGDGERGPDCDLGLAEADVAADEPVHRPRRLEVLLDGLDRPGLVVGLAVRERRLEPLEPLVREIEARALGTLALRVEREQLAGELAHRLARAALEVLPRLAAELGERGRLRVGADVA